MKWKIRYRPSKDELVERSKQNRFHVVTRPCRNCGSVFDYGPKKTLVCGLCVIEVKCEHCGKWFEWNGVLPDDQNKIEQMKVFCSRSCNISHPGPCSVCGKIGPRDQFGKGKINCDCSQKWYQKHNIELSKMNAAPGKCTRCGKLVENRSSAGLCGECINKQVKEQWKDPEFVKSVTQVKIRTAKRCSAPGKCIKCGAEVDKRNIMGVCQLCVKQQNQEMWSQPEYAEMMSRLSAERAAKRAQEMIKPGPCTMCGKHADQRNGFGVCNECLSKIVSKRWEDPKWSQWMIDILQKNAYKSIARNGDALRNCYIYQVDDVEGVQLMHLEEAVSGILLDDNDLTVDGLRELMDIPGVWALWGQSKSDHLAYCLTVGETKNLYREIRWAVRVLNNPYLQELEMQNEGSTGRWANIQSDYECMKFVLVVKGEEDQKKRMHQEMEYALKHNSLFWLPSVVQMHEMRP